MSLPRIAVVGSGAFGCNHLRVIHSSEKATLAGVFDIDSARAAAAAQPYQCHVFETIEDLARAAMERAIQKLPFKARFVVRPGTHGHAEVAI